MSNPAPIVEMRLQDRHGVIGRQVVHNPTDWVRFPLTRTPERPYQVIARDALGGEIEIHLVPEGMDLSRADTFRVKVEHWPDTCQNAPDGRQDGMDGAHLQYALKADAASKSMSAKALEMQIAIMHRAPDEEVERLRQAVLAAAEAYADAMAEVAHAHVKAIIG